MEIPVRDIHKKLMEFPRSSLCVLTSGSLYSQEILNNKIEIQYVSSYIFTKI